MRQRLASAVIVGSLVLTGAGLGASLAGAAETWVPVVDVSEPGLSGYSPVVAVDPAGNSTAAWIQSSGPSFVVMASQRPAGGAWTTPVALSATGQSANTPALAVSDNGTAVVVWSRSDGSTLRVQASRRAPAGSWSAPETLSEGGRAADDPQVAVDPDGRPTVLWRRSDGTSLRIQTSTVAADGSWTTPSTLSEAGQSASDPVVGTDGSGAATAAWVRYDGTTNRVQTSTRGLGGEWSIPVTLSDPGQEAVNPQVGITPAGSVTLTWLRNDGSNNRAQSASRQPGGAWSIPVNLSEPGQSASSAVSVDVDAAGNATATWMQNIGGEFRIRASSRPPGGAWSLPTTLSTTGGNSYYPVVTTRATTTVIAWLKFISGVPAVQVAVRTSTGAWGQPLTISGSASVNDVRIGGDAAGNAVVLWTGIVPGAGTNYRIQAAGLDAAGPVLTGFTVPATATAGHPVGLSLSAYDVWSAVAGTTWSFGDGTSGSGAAVSHTWSAPGTYTVTATTADAVGNATTRMGTITVGAAPIVVPPAAPTLGTIELASGTIHLTGPKKKQRTKVTVTVTVASKLTLTFKKKGVKKPLRLTRSLKAGNNTFTLTTKIGKKRLTPGKWKITAVAKNAAGTSTAKKLTLKVVR